MCELQVDLASNWGDILEIYEMMHECDELGIKFAKLQLFKKEQVREEYWGNILTEHMANEVFEYGSWLGLNVYFTPCYPEAVDICEHIGVNYYKIRYKDKNNVEIFNKLKNIKKPIFVSCQNPKDTLYHGMKNVIFLYCVHKYPAKLEDYNMLHALARCKGISDHTSNMDFFNMFENYFKYWEMHVALKKGTIEEKWSKTFEELKL